MLLLAWSASLFSVPNDALAVLIVRGGGGGGTEVGLLTAAQPLGAFVGSFLLGRFVRRRLRMRLLLPLALLSVAPLTLSHLAPGTTVLFVLWWMSGLGSSNNLPANAAFVQAVPAALRSRAFGVAVSGLQIAQAVGLLLAGALAELVAPARGVAAAGAVGMIVVIAIWVAWPRSQQPA